MFNNWKIFSDFNITDNIKEKLKLYYEILIEENGKYNLTRITEVNDVYEKHFLDSILFTKKIELTDQNIIDIGTGPGFPGIVLKIFFPNIKLSLVESNNKKINFLKLIVDKLNIKDVQIYNKRAEELSVVQTEKYDIVVSRAVAYLNIILEIGVQFLKLNGHFILLKGPRANEEIKSLNNMDKNLGLTLIEIQSLKDIGFGVRKNLFYKKNNITPKKYPRKYSQIIKK